MRLFVTPWTVAHQSPLSVEFGRQAYWSGLPFPSLGELSDPGIESASPVWPTNSLPLSHLGSLFTSGKKNFEHTRMLLIQRICATLSCTWNTFLQNIGGWVIHAPSSNLCLKTTSMRHMATICKTVTPTVATYPHSVLFHQHLTPPNILCNLTIYHWCIYDLFFFARVKPPSKQRICQFFFFPSCITSSWHIVHIRQKSDEREKGMNEKSGKY